MNHVNNGDKDNAGKRKHLGSIGEENLLDDAGRNSHSLIKIVKYISLLP